MRVLLAEDEPLCREATAERLKACGCLVVTATNGKEALAVLEKQSFDVVLMDVQMREMDGFDATIAIRLLEGATGGHVPIIALTAHAGKEQQERCRAVGMDACVLKPTRTERLLSVVRAVRSGQMIADRDGRGQIGKAPVLNYEELMDLVAGDLGLLAKVAGHFRARYPGLLSELRTAIAAGDHQALGRSAHQLKGMLSHLAAEAACAAATCLEMSARNAGSDTGAALRAVEVQVRALDDELRTIEKAVPGC